MEGGTKDMWKIAICDSDALFAEELAKEIVAFYQKRNFEVEISIYQEGSKLLDSMDSPKDVVFLNTRLKDAPGFGVAAFLRINQVIEHPLIVFLSDYKDDMQAAFEYHPVDFINKSAWKKELERAADRLWVWEHRARSVQIGTKRQNTIVRVSDIVYFESEGHFLTVHFANGDDDYNFRGNLSEYTMRLKDQYFAQPNKSCLVNCAYVDKLEDKVVMKDGTRLKYSKSRKQHMEEMMYRYAREMLRLL